MSNLVTRDLQHVWHPCSQMSDFIKNPPFIVNKARGSELYTNLGTLIDANSSWWCKSLGHHHPEVIHAIKVQLDKFEHVIAANTTNEVIVALAEKLAKLSGLQYSFYASEGSSSVEIAIKIALQAQQNLGFVNKNKIISLANGYHGETTSALSVSDVGIYKKPFTSYMQPSNLITNIPYVASIKNLEKYNFQAPDIDVTKVCAIILEPILQGAGGMKLYHPQFLKSLVNWAKKNNILVIADEIMTGFGRTGTWLACEHSKVQADIICMSKGLTSGTIPFSATMVDKKIYETFLGDHSKAFLHSHTFSGNPLGAAAALATIKAFEQEKIFQHVQILEKFMHEAFTDIQKQTNRLKNIRFIGGMIAADSETTLERGGFEVYLNALKLGAFLRPLGNTIYWMPPLNTPLEIMSNLAEITLNSIKRTK